MEMERHERGISLFCKNPHSYCSFAAEPGDLPSAHDPWLADFEYNAGKASDRVGLHYQWRG